MYAYSRNDFTAYNEAHTIIENTLASCNACSSCYRKEVMLDWMLKALSRAEKILIRYCFDDRWCSKHNKLKLREIVKSYIQDDLKMDEAALKGKAPQLYEPFLLGTAEAETVKTEEQDPSPEAIIPAPQYLIRSEKGLAMASLVDRKMELPGGAPMTAKDWIMIDVMTEAALNWIMGSMPDCSISFTDDDVWRWTGLTDWHVNQIKETFLRMLDLKIVAPCRTEYDEENRTWKQTTHYGHVFTAGKIITYGRLLGRKGRIVDNRSVKHEYHFFLDERYQHLLCNLAWGKALRLDKKLYGLSDKAQIIYRRFSLFKYDPKGSFFTFTQLAQLLGWPIEGSKQLISYRLKRIKLLLIELAEEGFILSEVKGSKKRGRETIFHLKEPKKGLKT